MYGVGGVHFYPTQKRYKSENGLHAARARHRPALPAVAPWPVPLLKRHGVELAHDARAAFAAAPTTHSPDRSCCSAGARRSRSLVERQCIWVPHAHTTHWLSCSHHSVTCEEWCRCESQCVGCACGAQTHFSFRLRRASVKKTAPQPCCVVPCEPVGRAGDKPDICRDPHVRWAQSGAGVATDRPEKGA